MADSGESVRISSLGTQTDEADANDFIVLDSVVKGTRKMLAGLLATKEYVSGKVPLMVNKDDCTWAIIVGAILDGRDLKLAYSTTDTTGKQTVLLYNFARIEIDDSNDSYSAVFECDEGDSIRILKASYTDNVLSWEESSYDISKYPVIVNDPYVGISLNDKDGNAVGRPIGEGFFSFSNVGKVLKIAAIGKKYVGLAAEQPVSRTSSLINDGDGTNPFLTNVSDWEDVTSLFTTQDIVAQSASTFLYNSKLKLLICNIIAQLSATTESHKIYSTSSFSSSFPSETNIVPQDCTSPVSVKYNRPGMYDGDITVKSTSGTVTSKWVNGQIIVFASDLR